MPACADWIVPVGYEAWERDDDPMWTWQAMRCAFCGWEANRLVRDHDHTSGVIRGLLCNACNTEEPYEWADPAWTLYREGCNPAGILGIYTLYEPYTMTIVEQHMRIRMQADPKHQRELAWATV